MLQLWLIRHGETAWSVAGQHTGRSDTPLTRHLALDTASPSLLGRQHGLPVVRSWNERCDLVEAP